MDSRNYQNKDLVILLIGIGSVILALFVPIFGIIAGLLGAIFGAKARKYNPTRKNSAAVIISLIGIIIGLGSIAFYMTLYSLYS